MKKIYLILIIQSYLLCNIHSQINELGVTIGNNFASHTNFDPTIPEDGQFQWNNLNGINLGVYSSFNLSERWNIRSSLNFQQKGYTEIAQTGVLGGTFNENVLSNRISYLTLGFFGDFVLNPKKEDLTFSLFIGVENNFQINRTLESELISPIADSYPVNEYQDNWNSYHLNYIVGFRTLIYNTLGASAFFSRSLNPVLKTDNLIVKDWIWGLSMDINLLEIFSKE